MPHIHPLYDFVVSVFIVHRDRVLLIYHKKYQEWLPIGGHIELNEDPEEALYREIEEECGLKVSLFSKAPSIAHEGVKPIPNPDYMDVHRIGDEHKHIAFIYFGISGSDQVILHEREHTQYRWIHESELKSPYLNLTRSIYFYSIQALKKSREFQEQELFK